MSPKQMQMPNLFISITTKLLPFIRSPLSLSCRQGFRSNAAMKYIEDAIGRGGENLVLYNYPSFTGAYAALFAHIFHTRRGLPCIVLPFSSVEPFRVDDFGVGAFDTCYLLDFVGPGRFAVDLSRNVSRVIAFDHREVSAKRVSQFVECPDNFELRVNTSKSSARAVYEYFAEKLVELSSSLDGIARLLDDEEIERTSTILDYIEDADLSRWKLSSSKVFQIGLRDLLGKVNCTPNPYVFKQLLEFDASHLIAKGNSMTCSRQEAAIKLADKAFKIQLGRGYYGECLACRIDGNSDLAHEIAIELSKKSAAAGLRPIGAVIFMQRTNLKMCLRTTDHATDTSEIAKEYGGGGHSSSSSFIIRMDEYNQWISNCCK